MLGRENLRDFLLRPLNVALRLLGRLHALTVSRACALHSALGEGLELKQLALFGVELAGSKASASARLDREA